MSSKPIFDIEIQEVENGYTVQAQNAYSVGELAWQPFTLPIDLSKASHYREDVAEWVDQARIVRRSGSEELKRAKEIGTVLFENVFSGELLAAFRESRKDLPFNEYLRVRLRLPDTLVSLPWELLFDPREDQFLALAPDLVLVRYPEIPTPITPLQIKGALRVVIVAASPNSLPPLNIEQELLRISTALKAPVDRGEIVLDIIRGVDTLSQLRTRLREPAHVIHYLGHGDLDSESGEGMLMFEDLDGTPERINAELLRVTIQQQRGQTQLVVLNACMGALPASSDPFSSVGAALLRAGVPAVIAMQFSIPDEVAIDLSRVFYTELAAGTPVDLAVNETRMQLYGRNPFRLDWVIPVLFLRTTDGTLFERESLPESDTASTTAVEKAVPTPVSTVPTASSEKEKPQPTRRNWLRFWPLLGCIAILVCLGTAGIAFSGLLRSWLASASQSPTSATHQALLEQGSMTTIPQTSKETLAVTEATEGNALSAPSFSTPVATLPPLTALNISNTAGRSKEVQIAVDAQGTVYLVWLDETPRQGESFTILYRKMAPDGTWSDIQDISPDLTYIIKPYLISNLNREVCLVANSVRGSYTSCPENGSWTSWENPGNAKSRNVFAPLLSPSREILWLAGLNELWFGAVKLDDGLAPTRDAQFVIDSAGNYHAAWWRQGNSWSIEYRFSDDSGADWQTQQQLSEPDAEFASRPAMTADPNGSVHLMWTETGKIVYRKWTAESGWQEPEEFGTGGAGFQVAVDRQNRPTVVWIKDCQVLYTVQVGENAWSPVQVLNSDASPSVCASESGIAIDAEGKHHIAWVSPGNDGESDVFYATIP